MAFATLFPISLAPSSYLLLPIIMSSRLNSVIGWICHGLVAAFTIFSGVMEFIVDFSLPEMVAYTDSLGITGMEYYIGAAKLAIVAVFLIPRTSTVGFVFMVGYFGGVLATHITHGMTSPAVNAPIYVVFLLLTIGAWFRLPELTARLLGKKI